MNLYIKCCILFGIFLGGEQVWILPFRKFENVDAVAAESVVVLGLRDLLDLEYRRHQVCEVALNVGPPAYINLLLITRIDGIGRGERMKREEEGRRGRNSEARRR